jgi:hypothetical protein
MKLPRKRKIMGSAYGGGLSVPVHSQNDREQGGEESGHGRRVIDVRSRAGPTPK